MFIWLRRSQSFMFYFCSTKAEKMQSVNAVVIVSSFTLRQEVKREIDLSFPFCLSNL